MKCIVAGGREFDDYKLLYKSLMSLGITEVVSGGARGADTLGESYAKECGLDLKIFKADWDGLGKRAGYVRNTQMADYVREEGGLVAFWNGESKGTKHMIDIAKRKGIKTIIIQY